jgi:hypothetical protein
MRAEAVNWDDWSVSNPPPMVENDKWHVQFSSDEVKIVSLEQLDDLFRLSIVDSETQVWQTGMTEWQPLRVIAGLEEEPAPQPKRGPPKPPTRAQSSTVRPAPPPARPDMQSVRPAAPAPRSASPSVRPAPPASPSVRPAPPAARQAHVAPASFYPEPILAAPSAYPAQSAYAAPIAFAPVNAMTSVRPLVVSHAPPIVQGGGGFGRFLVGIALLAGVGVTAYRNDYLREGAHAAHQEALYARLENALGGPAFGTVRAVEQGAAALPTSEASTEPTARMAIAASAPAPAAPSSPLSTTGTTPPVVSLESLSPEKKGQPAAAPVAVAPVPVRAVASLVQPKPAAAPAAAKTPPARSSAPPKPAVEKPKPVAQKPASEMNERERLNAAIGQSMMQSTPPKAKAVKSKGNNEYDPLNPSL